ncbi:drug/metabolite transporter superfamily [Hymenopellis radicata]|nr:drug/metabolite transporter superfamily [Hymenopellis radicata]
MSTVTQSTEHVPLLDDDINFKPSTSWLRDFYDKNVGLFLVAAAQFFFSIVDLSVQKLHGIDPPVTTLQLILVRMTITYILSILYMISMDIPHPFAGPPGVRGLLVFRGCSGFVGVSGLYYSLKYLTLSEATVISFLTPFMVAIAGAVFLKERLYGTQLAAGAVSLCGVILIARPEFLFGGLDDLPPVDANDRLVAVAAGIISCVGATGAYTTIRAIGSRAHALHSLTSFAGQSVLASAIGMILGGSAFVIPTDPVWLALFGVIGVFAFTAQFLLTMGLQRETAGRGTTAIYTQVVFATILENVFFEYTPSPWSVAGIVMIVTAALYVAVSKPKESIIVDDV